MGFVMLPEALMIGLQQYAIGPKIREFRRGKNLSLKQLGERTDISPGMLSKIERELQIPTLQTLFKVAAALEVPLQTFFVQSNPFVAVARKKERFRFPDGQYAGEPSYFFESLDFPLLDKKTQLFYAEFISQAKSGRTHTHPGSEFIYVISGHLIVNIEGKDIRLQKGDSVYFDSAHAHNYRRLGHAPCSAIVVVTR
jgi:transcriptional regulator with XRE-family HTH domain